MYNIKDMTYKSVSFGDKIPANFMSIETHEGRIIISGGGEPGKARKSCYEYSNSILHTKNDMLFERRAHTMTELLDDDFNSYIYAIGSSLPTQSMDKCEKYDLLRDKWTQLPDLSTKRNFHSSIAFKNRYIYVVAGFNGGQRTNMIEKLDTKAEYMEWKVIELTMKGPQTDWICLEGCGL